MHLKRTQIASLLRTHTADVQMRLKWLRARNICQINIDARQMFVSKISFLLKNLSLNSNIGVDAIGPETDLTTEKEWKSGHQVVNKKKWKQEFSNSLFILKHIWGSKMILEHSNKNIICKKS